MPGLQLGHAPDETSYDDGAAFKSVKAYLEGGSDATLASSAKALAGTLSGPPGTDGDDSHWSLYNLLISLAKQIPHDDPAMVRLVGVVDELSRSPKTALKESIDGVETLSPLHTFTWNLRDVFNPPFEPGRPPSEDQLSAYLSLHAFMALLWSRNLINGYDYAIWQFRSAFEQDIDDEKELVYESATASLWVIHAGSRLWQNVIDPPKLDSAEQRSLRGGSRFNGEPGYSKERWAFWGKALEERAGAGGFDAKFAQRAGSVMKGLEG